MLCRVVREVPAPAIASILVSRARLSTSSGSVIFSRACRSVAKRASRSSSVSGCPDTIALAPTSTVRAGSAIVKRWPPVSTAGFPARNPGLIPCRHSPPNQIVRRLDSRQINILVDTAFGVDHDSGTNCTALSRLSESRRFSTIRTRTRMGWPLGPPNTCCSWFALRGKAGRTIIPCSLGMSACASPSAP